MGVHMKKCRTDEDGPSKIQKNSPSLTPYFMLLPFFFSQKKFWGKVLTQIKTLCMVIIYNTRRKKKVARFLFGGPTTPLLTLCSLYQRLIKKWIDDRKKGSSTSGLTKKTVYW